MNCFYRLVLCSVVMFGVHACYGVNTEQTGQLLDALKTIMQESNNAASREAQEKAALYDGSCSEKEAVSAVLRAVEKAAHAYMPGIMVAMKNLGDIGSGLRVEFKNIRSDLFVSENIATVEQAIQNIESHNNRVLEIIEKAKAGLDQAS